MKALLIAAALAFGTLDAAAQEARAWMQADPSMQAGTFRFDVYPFSVFYGGSVGG